MAGNQWSIIFSYSILSGLLYMYMNIHSDIDKSTAVNELVAAGEEAAD